MLRTDNISNQTYLSARQPVPIDSQTEHCQTDLQPFQLRCLLVGISDVTCSQTEAKARFVHYSDTATTLSSIHTIQHQSSLMRAENTCKTDTITFAYCKRNEPGSDILSMHCRREPQNQQNRRHANQIEHANEPKEYRHISRAVSWEHLANRDCVSCIEHGRQQTQYVSS